MNLIRPVARRSYITIEIDENTKRLICVVNGLPVGATIEFVWYLAVIANFISEEVNDRIVAHAFHHFQEGWGAAKFAFHYKCDRGDCGRVILSNEICEIRGAK